MGASDEQLRERLKVLEQRDVEQRSQVAAYGVNLSEKRKIDLTFWAPDQPASIKFVEALNRNELPPSVVLKPASAADPDQRWLIRASFFGSVDFVTTQENIATFIMFADKFNCEYDGWGTAIVEGANNPPST